VGLKPSHLQEESEKGNFGLFYLKKEEISASIKNKTVRSTVY